MQVQQEMRTGRQNMPSRVSHRGMALKMYDRHGLDTARPLTFYAVTYWA